MDASHLKVLKQKAKCLPDLPGVYLMKDTFENVIYVGKSKHLKTRVSGYFGSLKHERPKVKRMVNAIYDFEYQLTDTELDALLLECQLIKVYQPIYNSLLKNDKKYRFIKVEERNGLRSLGVAYEKEEGRYFGPYDLPYLLQKGVAALNSYYKLPTCKAIIPKEDCLIYRLNQCLAPCENISVQVEALQSAIDFLEGKDIGIIEAYTKAMTQALEELAFEKAALYHEQLSVLKMLGYRQEAIHLSELQSRGMALIKCPLIGFKLYVLAGTTIRFTKLIKTPSKQILLNILSNIYKSYLSSPFERRYHLEKSEIDEALIMYYYLHTKVDCQYVNCEQHCFDEVCNTLADFYFSSH